MQKTCKQCGLQFEITKEDVKFYDMISPVYKGDKYQISNPTFCPTCRDQRRLAWRNERKLYKRKCNAAGKNIISIYSADSNYIVYSQNEWWSDKWNGMDYGIYFDFNKSFFEQFNELFLKVPKMNMIGSNNENSNYCNLVADLNNCYLVFESSNNEDCLYGYWLQKCKNCVDSNYLHECELCFESENCYGCYDSKFLQNCKNCSQSSFLKDCIGCKNCFGCVNLQNKEYYFLNKKYSKEEYSKIINELHLENFLNLKKFKKTFADFSKKNPNKYAQIQKSENCTGDYIENCNNCVECFHAHESENCKYSEHVWRNAKYVMDASTAGRNAELIYESINCGINAYSMMFSSQCWSCSDVLYSINCHNISNCFGCTGLKNHEKYMILNKQYTKQEYETLIPKIIEHMRSLGEWGEFFPTKLSPFAYNETVAQEYFPLNKQQVVQKFGKWKDTDEKLTEITKIIPAEKLPDDINDIPDDILTWAIKCEISQKPFKIIHEELKFYRENNIPIPHLHPELRHKERTNLRNPRKLFNRECDKCNKSIQTTYAPEREEIVYCERCYLKEIY